MGGFGKDFFDPGYRCEGLLTCSALSRLMGSGST